MYEYRAKVTKIYDGDTITCDIDLGFGMQMNNQKIRLYGINTPEIKGVEREQGLKSREELISRIREVDYSVILRTHRDRQGKFGRWLAEVYINGQNINHWMVKNGHAKEYMV